MNNLSNLSGMGINVLLEVYMRAAALWTMRHFKCHTAVRRKTYEAGGIKNSAKH